MAAVPARTNYLTTISILNFATRSAAANATIAMTPDMTLLTQQQ